MRTTRHIRGRIERLEAAHGIASYPGCVVVLGDVPIPECIDTDRTVIVWLPKSRPARWENDSCPDD